MGSFFSRTEEKISILMDRYSGTVEDGIVLARSGDRYLCETSECYVICDSFDGHVYSKRKKIDEPMFPIDVITKGWGFEPVNDKRLKEIMKKNYDD